MEGNPSQRGKRELTPWRMEATRIFIGVVFFYWGGDKSLYQRGGLRRRKWGPGNCNQKKKEEKTVQKREFINLELHGSSLLSPKRSTPKSASRIIKCFILAEEGRVRNKEVRKERRKETPWGTPRVKRIKISPGTA